MAKDLLTRKSKAELLRLATHRCEHGHRMIEHPQCANEPSERVGILDIETSNLDADYGFIITWAIKVQGTNEVLTGVITEKDIKKGGKTGTEDKRLVRDLIDAMLGFDLLITHYGTKFDIPYIRTRALVCGVEFPHYGILHHQDMYYIARHRLKLSRNSLDNVCRTVLGNTEKTRVPGDVWRQAARGDKKSIDYVLDHNIRDVNDTERAYAKLAPFARVTKRAV